MQDIHPTIMKVAGIALPTDRVFDGLDLSPVLFAKDRTAASALSRADKGGGHACFFYYRAATWTNATEEIYAVRCGDHKVYWRTWGVAPPEGSTCSHLASSQQSVRSAERAGRRSLARLCQFDKHMIGSGPLLELTNSSARVQGKDVDSQGQDKT